MWQCDNCGYTDEDGTTFEEEVDRESEEHLRFCPECGSDEVYQVDEDESGDADVYDADDDDDDDEASDDDDAEVDDWED